MPPKKTPRKPKSADEERGVLVLFAQNLDEMLRVNRAESDPGPTIGYRVGEELVIGKVKLAISLALEGKHWEAPGVSP